MFSELRDNISLLFSWRWPTAVGAITCFYVDPGRKGFQIGVAYEFSIESDGPYTGESWAPFWFSGTGVIIKEQIRIGQEVTVRYKRKDPSVSRLERSFWQDLEGL